MRQVMADGLGELRHVLEKVAIAAGCLEVIELCPAALAPRLDVVYVGGLLCNPSSTQPAPEAIAFENKPPNFRRGPSGIGI